MSINLRYFSHSWDKKSNLITKCSEIVLLLEKDEISKIHLTQERQTKCTKKARESKYECTCLGKPSMTALMASRIATELPHFQSHN